MLTIEQQLNEKDYAKFVDFSIFERKPFNKIFLLYIAPVLGLGLLISFFLMGEESNVLFIVLCVLLIVLGWLMKLLFRKMSSSNFKRNPALGLKNIILFDGDEIKTTSKQGVSKNKYIQVNKIYVIKDYLIVYFKNQRFLGINTSNLQLKVTEDLIQILKEKCLGKMVYKIKAKS